MLDTSSKAQEFIQKKLGPGVNLSQFTGYYWDTTSVGFTDERRITTSQNIFYDIASITKSFTATQILLLIDQGLLNLDEKVNRFAPYLIDFDVTVRDLLTHRHNLIHKKYFDKNKKYTKPELHTILKNRDNITSSDKLGYNYTDFGYDVLGDVLETIHTARLDEILTQFCSTYNLSQILYSPIDNGIPPSHIAQTRNDLEPGISFDERARNYNGLAGHAGIFATLSGLQQFAQAWLYNAFELSDELFESAFLPTHEPTNNRSFGLVWRRGLVSKMANITGYCGPTMILNPAQEFAIVHTCNWTFPRPNEDHRQEFRVWNYSLA